MCSLDHSQVMLENVIIRSEFMHYSKKIFNKLKMHNKSNSESGLFKPHCRRVCFYLSCSFVFFCVCFEGKFVLCWGHLVLINSFSSIRTDNPKFNTYSWAVCIFVRVRGEKEMSVAVIDIVWLGVLRKQALSDDRPLCDRFSSLNGTAFVLVHVMCPGKKRQKQAMVKSYKHNISY